ncbi:unnamed protein product [Mytilus coruscus]|uniref:Uncharacterized protein n=1 Tax=Mytilus coruscus TaxID=42192 RepID=A0A6J8B3E0_MYTCO|nr:unnamed protein product [Mytilus coruscus]
MNKLTTNDSLHSAVAEKKFKLLKILLEGGSEVNRRAYDGKTALMIICCDFGVDHDEEYIIDVLRLLLKHKADPNVQDRKGRTAIMYALRNLKPKKVMNILLKHGADPFICDNFGKNAFSFIRTECWSQYSDSFSQYVEPTKQQYLVVPTATSMKDKYIDKIKACRSPTTQEKRVYSLGYHDHFCRLLTCTQLEKIKNKTCDNNIHGRTTDDVFCPHSASPGKEDAVTVENTILRRVSHIPSYKNVDISCSSVIKEAECGNIRQERVNSDPTTKSKDEYKRDPAYSLQGKRRQKPLRRHSSSLEASTNGMFIFNKDEGRRTWMFGKNVFTGNSDSDISLNDKNFLKHGTLTTNNSLHSAVAEKKFKLWKILLEGGSEVNRRAYDRKTALMIICCDFGVDHNEEYIIDVLRLLLKHKADPNVQDCKDPFICDNFGKNAFSFNRTECWSQYSDSFSQYVEPTKQQYLVVPTATSMKDKYIDKIKACMSPTTEEERVYSLGYYDKFCRLLMCTKLEKIKDETCDNNIPSRFTDDVFCSHPAPPGKEDAVTVENIILRRVSHNPNYKNVDISCSSVIKKAELGNERQERVSSDSSTNRKAEYERDRAYSLQVKRRQKPLRRHSSSVESSSNKMFIFNKNERGRTVMFGKNVLTRNFDTDISLNDKFGAVRYFPKLPPIEKIPNQKNKYALIK